LNNEPVAYVNSMCNDYIDWKIDPMSIDGQALYTHPAKTLTDEEIWEVINRTAWVGTEEEIRFKIAEAILKKAQDK
jgi:hypothetical protein